MHGLDLLVLALYFAALIALGLRAMGRVRNQEEFFLGGRSFGKLLQTFAAFGAGTGAHEPVTVGRTVWTSGLSGVWSAMLWLFVTPVYWITAVWYRRMRHLTLGDWFVERYESRGLGAAYALFAIVFYMFYLSTMFSAIAKFAVPLLGTETLGGVELKYWIVPALAGTVVCYGVLGGLTAAYWTDLLQGLCIIGLSVILIPLGLQRLVELGAADGGASGSGWSVLHERLSPDMFRLFGGPVASEFPWYYVVSLTLLALVGIVVQPHFIATGGGSARSEDAARIGLVAGNFLKRLCTIGWAATGLIALAWLSANPAATAEIAADPDRVWGVASREILGPLGAGLVGLMFACLMAAMMSSADAYMLVTSALIVRNLYAAYLRPAATDRECVAAGRLTSVVLIAGAVGVALRWADVFGQFKMAIEIPILFAAPFWVGLYWRRATRAAVWGTMAFSAIVFFILPLLLPLLKPGWRSDPRYTLATPVVVTSIERPAAAVDVARWQHWRSAEENAQKASDPAARAEALRRIGPAPPQADTVGRSITVPSRSGGQAIFWRDGLAGDAELELIERRREGAETIEVYRAGGSRRGKGSFQLDLAFYSWLGWDLSRTRAATLETLRLPPRLAAPFAVLILLSLVTRPNRREVLDRYYAKMKTEVRRDPEADRRALEEAYADPGSLEGLKLFPHSSFEFLRPRTKDIVGVVVSVAICLAIVGLLMALAVIGS